MRKIHIALALIIICVAPSLAEKFSGDTAPSWMTTPAIIGLVIGIIILFLPTKKDLGM